MQETRIGFVHSCKNLHKHKKESLIYLDLHKVIKDNKRVYEYILDTKDKLFTFFNTLLTTW